MRSTFGTALLVVILASVVPAPAMQSGDDTLHVVLPKDAIRAIDRPAFEAAKKADRVMDNDELVPGFPISLWYRTARTAQRALTSGALT